MLDGLRKINKSYPLVTTKVGLTPGEGEGAVRGGWEGGRKGERVDGRAKEDQQVLSLSHYKGGAGESG